MQPTTEPIMELWRSCLLRMHESHAEEANLELIGLLIEHLPPGLAVKLMDEAEAKVRGFEHERTTLFR